MTPALPPPVTDGPRRCPSPPPPVIPPPPSCSHLVSPSAWGKTTGFTVPRFAVSISGASLGLAGPGPAAGFSLLQEFPLLQGPGLETSVVAADAGLTLKVETRPSGSKLQLTVLRGRLGASCLQPQRSFHIPDSLGRRPCFAVVARGDSSRFAPAAPVWPARTRAGDLGPVPS